MFLNLLMEEKQSSYPTSLHILAVVPIYSFAIPIQLHQCKQYNWAPFVFKQRTDKYFVIGVRIIKRIPIDRLIPCFLLEYEADMSQTPVTTTDLPSVIPRKFQRYLQKRSNSNSSNFKKIQTSQKIKFLRDLFVITGSGVGSETYQILICSKYLIYMCTAHFWGMHNQSCMAFSILFSFSLFCRC